MVKQRDDIEHRDSQTAQKLLRYGALAAPIVMVTYGLLVENGTLPIIHQSTAPTTATIIGLTAAWLALAGIAFMTIYSHKYWIRASEVTAYYILATLQTWLINGMMSPFSAYWVLLIVATFVLLGKRGLAGGLILFTSAVAVDAFVLSPDRIEWTIVSAMTAVTIATTSLVIILVYSSQRTSHQELMDSMAREARERDRALTLINNITDAVFSIDQKGIVKTYNSAALNLLDTNERIDGQYISELIELEADDTVLDVFEELSKNSTIRQRDDIIMRLADDDLLRLEATFAPVQTSDNSSETPDNYVLILRDITRMKSLEEERDEFISVVSHELRTPVTIAEGSLSNAEILSERGHHEKVSQAISEAHKQVLFLARMVNDLSTLSRAERGVSDEVETIRTLDLAHQLHSEYAPQAQEKGLVFNLDVIGKPHNVRVSRLYLQELLQNFLTNAIKYTPEGSVTLRIKNIEDEVQFQVADTGIGIGKSDLNKIFARFYRAEDYRTRETSGTGLGLYVSTKLARKLGCKIDVQSRLNHGSTFSFTLPGAEEYAGKTTRSTACE